ncbi:MAG: bifunctional hydroxymethylpyrimidine kinase/phosphomethylpyrimidine kinase [Candidatus Eisenbacteria bacterium]|nr:bifunctional hydroxymethylpyrimidine kinase/phosphomethylpyrimidine kinase [Candidatus Latescibacterota bacterium]MBD3301451.1 bifunctional hydroxymethylpyrimidine kinase/phosphomethylpyrimidine kinase [Candidatus Eisenbacteria bacterium]
MIPQILTIAGSDSGGGAGIQADLKSIQANGGYGLSVLTSITAQNTRAVVEAHDLPASLIESQLEAVFDDFEIAAVKTGMLSSAEIVRTVAGALAAREIETLVVDPVMISKSGFALLEPEAVAELRDRLLPLALLVTPNRHETAKLAGLESDEVADEATAVEAGRRILRSGCRAVLVKGGHLGGNESVDILVAPDGIHRFPADRIDTRHTHGTGCTYASAIATWLGRGLSLEEAIHRAKVYITEAIRHALPIGGGHGPTDHFWFLRKESGI